MATHLSPRRPGPESTDPRLAAVVIPAHNEEQTIDSCLEALAAQTLGSDRFEIILVLDACSDATERVARAGAARLGLTLLTVPGPGRGSGPARKAGMDLAATRLMPDALLATTDADTRPAPDWLARQLDHLRDGARVVAGLIELDDELPAGVLSRRTRDTAARLAEAQAADPTAAHHHFAGASLGLTPALYRQVGGLEPTLALEDEAFAERLRDHRVAILRPADVRVRTSARRHGRAQRGLSVDLAVSDWFERRRYRGRDFAPERLVAMKAGQSVTVIIPTKECATTIGRVLATTVTPLREAGLVDSVVVVDAASLDDTARHARAAGAEVLQQDELLLEYGRARGKGDAMWRALAASGGDVVCFLDGDTEDPDPIHLSGLLGPLFADRDVQLVKGAFERPLSRNEITLPVEGGRVTELMARPLLNLHFPLVAGFSQPLAGEFAARRTLLEQLRFPVGYGVEIALLLDALKRCGLAALAESDLGTRQNRHQPLRALGEMAYAVLAAVEQRLEQPRSTAGGHYLQPWADGAVTRVPVAERPPLAELLARPRRPVAA